MPTTADPDFQAARAARRRRRQSRQAVIFGTLIAFLAVAAVFGGLVATETIASPFKQNFTKVDEEGGAPEPWCPQGDMLPVDAATIQVVAINGTKHGGLGKRVAEDLGSRGFVIAGEPINAKDYKEVHDYTDNANARATVEIHYGPTMANQALTIAAHLKNAELWPDDRADNVIDVVARKLYSGPVELDKVDLVADQPLKAPAKCRAVPLATGDPAADGTTEDPPPEEEPDPNAG